MGGCGRVFGRGIIQQVSNLLPKSNLEKKEEKKKTWQLSKKNKKLLVSSPSLSNEVFTSQI